MVELALFDRRHLYFTGKEMVDYIADYLENIRNRRVLPNVSPGYMRHLVPESAPIKGEDWNVVINDVERVIMPGVRDVMKYDGLR